MGLGVVAGLLLAILGIVTITANTSNLFVCSSHMFFLNVRQKQKQQHFGVL